MKWACNHCGECCKGVARAGLKEKEDGTCVNWGDNKCLIYDNRPKICRSNRLTPGFLKKIACNYLMDKGKSEYARL